MLNFTLFRIPVSVDWWFWLTTVLLGGGLHIETPRGWLIVGVWTAVVFVSIIVHELGHALAGRKYGAVPAIHLHGFGGSTFLPGGHFSRKQSIIVSAAGPLAGLLLGLLVLAISPLVIPSDPLVRIAVQFALYVNFFWTFFNLLPIQPLDGGQILREALGPRRLLITSRIGFVLATVLGIWALMRGAFFQAILLGILAYHNYRQDPIEGGVVKS